MANYPFKILPHRSNIRVIICLQREHQSRDVVINPPLKPLLLAPKPSNFLLSIPHEISCLDHSRKNILVSFNYEKLVISKVKVSFFSSHFFFWVISKLTLAVEQAFPKFKYLIPHPPCIVAMVNSFSW